MRVGGRGGVAKIEFIYIGYIYAITSMSKQKIPASLRQKVWEKDAKLGSYNRTCPICNTNTISAFSFECGHIVPESKGGTTELGNLRAVCSLCNKSMGTKNMNTFRANISSTEKPIPHAVNRRNVISPYDYGLQPHNKTIVDFPSPELKTPETEKQIVRCQMIEKFESLKPCFKARAHMADGYDLYEEFNALMSYKASNPDNIIDNMNGLLCRFKNSRPYRETVGFSERNFISDTSDGLNNLRSKYNSLT